jgi:Uma2 family endonuclease
MLGLERYRNVNVWSQLVERPLLVLEVLSGDSSTDLG